MEKFGVDGIFTPEKPVLSAKGALVTNIAYIPAALTAVMRENATRPDFAPEGSLALKAWFGSDRGLELPEALNVPVVEATPPYSEQIAALNEQIGAVLPRQSMKDMSGASQMDPKTQVTSLHGVSVLEAAQYPMESNVCLALLHEPGGENDSKLVNVAIGAEVNLCRRRHARGGAGRARSGQRAQQRARRGGEHRRSPPPGRGPQGAARADRAVREGRIAGRERRNLRSGQGGAGHARAVHRRPAGPESRGDAGGIEAREARNRSSCAICKASAVIRRRTRCSRRSRRRSPGAR